jgi:phage-related protein (TIGR01555 family)
MKKKRGPGRPRKIENAKPKVKIEPLPVKNELISVQPKVIKNQGFPFGGQGIGGGSNQIGFPGFWGSESVTQANNIYPNLRWYLISNNPSLLSEMYAEMGLIQTICDVPVQDALRGGIELKSKQINENEIEEVILSMELDDDLSTIGETAQWNRLHGGAGTIIMTDQDPELPLDLSMIGPDTPIEFRSADKWELNYGLDGTFDPSFMSDDFSFYYYYGIPVHKSRVLTMKGILPPSYIRGKLQGWGLSVIEALVNSVNQYTRATNVAYEVLNEFKLDIFKIKNFADGNLAPEGLEQTLSVIRALNYQKSYQNAMILDADDEFQQKQLSFSGLGEAMQQIRMQVSADMRIPMLKLFGMPATGLNAGDEDSIEVYNAMIESSIRAKIKHHILKICQIKCQKLFGFIPDDLSISFKPLRMMSAKEEEEVKTLKLDRLIKLRQIAEISSEDLRNACNKDKLIAVSLDPTEEIEGPELEEETVTEEKTTEQKPKVGEL